MTFQELTVLLNDKNRVAKIESLLISHQTTLEQISKLLLENNKPRLIYVFLKAFPNVSERTLLFEAIEKSKDTRYIFLAASLPDAPISSLSKATIFSQDEAAILNFMEQIQGAPLVEMGQSYIKIRKVRYFVSYLSDIINKQIEMPNIRYYLDPSRKEYKIPIEKFIKKFIETTIRTHSSFSTKIDKMKKKDKLELLNIWLNDANFAMVECYGEYLLKENPSEEERIVADQKYRLFLLKCAREKQKTFSLDK